MYFAVPKYNLVTLADPDLQGAFSVPAKEIALICQFPELEDPLNPFGAHEYLVYQAEA